MLEKKERSTVIKLKEISEGFFENNDLIERVDFLNLEFDSWRFRNTNLRSSTFHKCKFVNCIFDDMDLQRVSFIESELQDCVFSKGFRFISGLLENTSIQNCDFDSSFIQNIKWINCVFDDVNFNFIKAKSISFSGSDFKKISFDGASIVRGNFKGVANLKRSLFFDSKLDDCEFDWNDAFVVMAFGDHRYNELYKYAIEPVLKKYEVTPRRVDQYEFHGRITDEILERIITSKVVIAECSATSKNVYFEIGFALGNKKKIILCVDSSENIPFDLKDFPFVIHENKIEELEKQLERKLRFVLGISTEE